MPRIDTNQDTAVSALVDHLRSTLKLNERNCFEVLEPMAPPRSTPGGDYFVTVADGDGVYPLEEQIKTSTDNPGQLMEELQVFVTGFTSIRLDSPEHDHKLLRDSKRGLRELKRKLLRALLQQDLVDKNGNHFLRNPLYIIRAGKFGYDPEKQIGWVMLTFGVDFDWDLSDGV